MKLELGEEAYRIVSDSGDEGELTDYEDAATLETDGNLYVAFLDSETVPRQGIPDITVFKLTPVTTTTESVEFDEDGGDDVEDGDPEPDSEGSADETTGD